LGLGIKCTFPEKAVVQKDVGTTPSEACFIKLLGAAL